MQVEWCVHSGERQAGAFGDACLTLPGLGDELVIPAPDTAGIWWLWIRYRDEDRKRPTMPSFAVMVDGTSHLELTVPGGSKRWLWARCQINTHPDSRIVVRTTSAGVRDLIDPDYPYRAATRIDAVRLVTDPDYAPTTE